MATTPSPDSFGWRQIQEAARYYNANRASIEQAARLCNQLAPTICMIQHMAPTMAMVERMQLDMKMANMLARQHAQLTAMLPTIPVPTEAELAETQDWIVELVPEDEEERQQVADLPRSMLSVSDMSVPRPSSGCRFLGPHEGSEPWRTTGNV